MVDGGAAVLDDLADGRADSADNRTPVVGSKRKGVRSLAADGADAEESYIFGYCWVASECFLWEGRAEMPWSSFVSERSFRCWGSRRWEKFVLSTENFRMDYRSVLVEESQKHQWWRLQKGRNRKIAREKRAG
jgi:hypothetical protein